VVLVCKVHSTVQCIATLITPNTINHSTTPHGDKAQNRISGSLSSDLSLSGSRQKRSWSGFWSTLFGTATSEEVQKIYDSEYLLSQEEQETRQSLNELTGANKKMVSTMKKVFSSVSTLQDKQTAI